MDRALKFYPDLLIRDPCRPFFGIIRQITEMDQQGQYVIFASEGHHVVGKSKRIDFYFQTADQLRDGFCQPVIILADIFHQAVRSGGLRPIGSEFIKSYRFHDGIRIVNRTYPFERISIIPLFHCLKTYIIFAAQRFYFFLSKSDIFTKHSRLNDRKFIEIRDSRLGAVFFDRKNTGHICSGKYFCGRSAAFEKHTEEFQVCHGNFRCLPNRCIPLVNDHDKFVAGKLYRMDKQFIERRCGLHIRISAAYFCRNRFFNKGKQIFRFCFPEKVRHVEVNHVEAVDIFLVCRVSADGQIGKQRV